MDRGLFGSTLPRPRAIALEDGETHMGGPRALLILVEFVESTNTKRVKAVHSESRRRPQCRTESAPRTTSEWDRGRMAWCR